MIVVLMLASGTSISNLRVRAMDDTVADNHRLGVVLAEQTMRTLQSADLVLQEISDKLVRSGINDLDLLYTDFGGRDVHEELAKRLVDLPQAEAFTLVDRTGHIINESRTRVSPAYTLIERDYLKHFAAGPDPGAYISVPEKSLTSGQDVVFLARQLRAADGTFLGVAVAPIRLKYFNDFFVKTGFSDGTAINILRKDGVVLVRFPQAGVSPGTRIPAKAQWYGVVAAGQGHYRSPGAFANVGPSFVSVHPLTTYPIVVDVVRSEGAALQHWWQQAAWIAAGTASAALFMSLLLAAMTRQITMIEASQDRISQQVAALASGQALLQTTLDFMDQGLLMVDAAGRVAVCNRRAEEILELPPDLMAGKPAISDVIAYQQRNGEFPAQPDAFFDPQILVSDISRYERRRANGSVFEARTRPLPGGGWVRTYTDTTARVAAEEMLGLAASRDQMTGLANRNGFHTRLEAAIAAARRTNRDLVLLCLDLDRFKAVNDSLGHAAGDQLLTLVAQRMNDIARGTDVIGRMGGDEFAIVLPGASLAAAIVVSERLLEAIRSPYTIAGKTVRIGTSIGIAVYPQGGGTSEQLLRNADTAMYKAKAAGRNTWCAYESTDGDREAERQDLETDILSAVELKQFTLAYQPICQTSSGLPVAYEALLRWKHPRRGQVSPSDFIPVAEQSGQMIPLGRWVLETACTEAAAWALPLNVAVNLSPMQFRDRDLVAFISDLLARTGLPPTRLDLEVTEGMLLEDTPEIVSTMKSLRAMGLRLVLDDFGTANSNLSCLQGFPFDGVKIDRSFLRALNSDPQARGLVEGILGIARSLKLDVVGKGVETQEQLALLRHLNCRWVQGFLLGRPVPSREVRDMIWKRLRGHAENENPIARVPGGRS